MRNIFSIAKLFSLYSLEVIAINIYPLNTIPLRFESKLARLSPPKNPWRGSSAG